MSEPIDFSSMKVADLKKELKTRGLTTSGNKNELIDRLQMAVMANESDILSEEDLLTEKPKDSDEQNKAKKVTIKRGATVSATSESEGVAHDAANDGSPSKKKANVITPPDDTTSPNKEIPEMPEEETSKTADETEKPKASTNGLTDAEKAKARAERFGLTEFEAKKQARAERFGLKNKIGAAPTVDMETLKKRAERFGQSSSNTLKNMEAEEKIRQRQERFGKVGTTTKGPKVAINVDEKMKKRAERFGLTV